MITPVCLNVDIVVKLLMKEVVDVAIFTKRSSSGEIDLIK